MLVNYISELLISSRFEQGDFNKTTFLDLITWSFRKGTWIAPSPSFFERFVDSNAPLLNIRPTLSLHNFLFIPTGQSQTKSVPTYCIIQNDDRISKIFIKRFGQSDGYIFCSILQKKITIQFFRCFSRPKCNASNSKLFYLEIFTS